MDFDAINDAMAFMDDWEARYAFLIDLGRNLPAYADEARAEAHRVPGCTSKVWMVYGWVGGRLRMAVDSDAHLVKGLLAVLMALYDGKTAADIRAVAAEPAFAKLGLEGNLSPNRRNGFFAVAKRIDQLAQAQG